jgi:hypothetical protein
VTDSAQSGYWLYRWIDDQGIRRTNDLFKVLRNRRAIDAFIERYEKAQQQPYTELRAPREALIAGRRVDLSGYLDCPHFECVQRHVDVLFGRTWHYFDTIVVDDPRLDLPADGDVRQFIWDVEQRVRLLLYLRQIGADNHLMFTKKVGGFCKLHFREYAKKIGVGLDALFDDDLQNEVVRELLAGATVSIKGPREDGHWRYEINHPRIERIAGGYSHHDADIRPTAEEVVRDAVGWYCAGLISDIAAVRDLKLPLLQVAEDILLPYPVGNATVDESIVALNLRLPVLTGASAKEILRFKSDENAQFERFKSALRTAIREQISRAGSSSPEEIAQAVIEEYINPELAEIKRGLEVTRRRLARQVNAGIAVGGATVTAGAIASIPLVIGTGVAAIATTVPQIYKYYDGRSKLEMSDLYFLWKASLRHRARH